MTQLQPRTKYKVSYSSGTSGFGWDRVVSTIKEVNELISGIKDVHQSFLYVYDRDLKDFVFYKRALMYKPDIDLLRGTKRDPRTTTRKAKGVFA